MWILDLILLTDNKMMLHGPKQSLAGIIQDNSYAIYNPCFFFVIIEKQGLDQRGLGLSLLIFPSFSKYIQKQFNLHIYTYKHKI